MKIDRQNAPILQWDESHPARRFLEIHAKFCTECIAFEIYGYDGCVSDLEWFSKLKCGNYKLSSIFYAYISFTPILVDWLDETEDVSEYESRDLLRIEECRTLLLEASASAREKQRSDCFELIDRCEEVLDAWEASIVERQA